MEKKLFRLSYLLRNSGDMIWDDCMGWVYSGDKRVFELVEVNDLEELMKMIEEQYDYRECYNFMWESLEEADDYDEGWEHRQLTRGLM